MTYHPTNGIPRGMGVLSLTPRVAATASSAVYSAPGRVTQMTGQDGTSTYGYDSTSQLTSATHTFQTNESYSYDDNGNRDMTGYQTGDDNQMTNDGTYSYTYDEEGNRTRRTNTSTSEVTDYEWDYRNRLTKVTEKNSSGTTTQVVEFTYDMFDRKIGKEVDTTSPFTMTDAVIERYVYDDIHNSLASLDGGNVVLDFVDTDASDSTPISMSKRYLHGNAVDQVLAQEDVSKTLSDTQRNLWQLADNLGTVRDLAKQDGTIAVHYKYDAYGNVTSGDTSKTRYLFTGREFDADVDLQYNRARWYDPEVGRWISEDPIGFVAGDVNLNRYVGNEGTDWVDPSGAKDKPIFHRGKKVARIYEIRSDWDDYDEAIERGYIKPGLYVRYIAVPVAKMFLPRSDPDTVIEYGDGTEFIIIGGGPSTGDLVGQGLVIGGIGGVGSKAPGGIRAIGKRFGDEVIDTAVDEVLPVPIVIGKKRSVAPVPSIRPHRDLVDDFSTNPHNWERTWSNGAQGGGRLTEGGVSIEGKWRNKNTGEILSTHEAFTRDGDEIHHGTRQSPNLPHGGSIRPGNRGKEQ